MSQIDPCNPCNACNPCNLTMTVSAIANLLADHLCNEELDLAASLFSQLGDTLDAIGASRALCEASSKRSLPSADQK